MHEMGRRAKKNGRWKFPEVGQYKMHLFGFGRDQLFPTNVVLNVN